MNGETKLVAFRVERRSVAAAVFIGRRLDYAAVRELSSIHEKAEASAVAFANWINATFKTTAAVVERFENGEEMLRARIYAAIEASVRDNAASLYKVGKQDLLEAFGHPPISGRPELRQVVTTIWPILSLKKESGTKLDAVALGLYIQTERLFQN